MNKLKTKELEHILQTTALMDMDQYLKTFRGELLCEDKPFASYVREHFKTKGLLWQDVFLKADVDEDWGYRIIEERARTRQRDLLIRIFYAAEFTLDEVQHALNIYGMSPLSPEIDRDAVLIISFNTRPGTILDVNAKLRRYNLKPLRFFARPE